MLIAYIRFDTFCVLLKWSPFVLMEILITGDADASLKFADLSAMKQLSVMRYFVATHIILCKYLFEVQEHYVSRWIFKVLIRNRFQCYLVLQKKL